MSHRRVRCRRPALEQCTQRRAAGAAGRTPRSGAQFLSRQGRVPSVRGVFAIGFTSIVRSLWCHQLLSLSGMLLSGPRASHVFIAASHAAVVIRCGISPSRLGRHTAERFAQSITETPDAVSISCFPPRRRERGHVRAFEEPGHPLDARRGMSWPSSRSAA